VNNPKQAPASQDSTIPFSVIRDIMEHPGKPLKKISIILELFLNI